MDGDAISFAAAFERRQRRTFSRSFEDLNPLRQDNPWKDGIDGFVAQGTLPAVPPEASAPFELPTSSRIEGPKFDARSAGARTQRTADVIQLVPHRRCTAVEV